MIWPLLVTLAAFYLAWHARLHDDPNDVVRWAQIVNAVFYIIAGIASTFAWLIWAVLT